MMQFLVTAVVLSALLVVVVWAIWRAAEKETRQEEAQRERLIRIMQATHDWPTKPGPKGFTKHTKT